MFDYNYSMQRKKKHQLQVQKENYRQHIVRLQKLKQGNSPDQVRKAIQRKRISELLANIKKFHNRSKSFRNKQTLALEQYEKSKQKDYTKVESIVKKDIKRFDQLALTSVEKQNKPKYKIKKIWNKPNTTSLHILKTTKYKNHQQNSSTFYDLSKIYEQSKIHTQQQRQIKIRLGKDWKLKIQFQRQDFLEFFRELDQFYVMQVKCGNKGFKSEDILLCELIKSQIYIYLSDNCFSNNNLTIIFSKIIDSKQLKKAQIQFQYPQICHNPEIFTTPSNPHSILSDTKQLHSQKRHLHFSKPIKGTPKKLNISITVQPSKKQLKTMLSFYKNKQNQDSSNFKVL